MRLAVVGLDSADWALLDPWLHHLPNLAVIRREGVSGALESCPPPVTIPAWKCYSTGKNPGRFGVYWFARLDFQRRRLVLNFPGDIGGNLWDFIPKSLVVNTPGTYPPRVIDGILVAGFPCPDDEPFVAPPWARAKLGDYRVNTRTSPGDEGFEEEVMELIALRFDTFLRLAQHHQFGQVTVFYIDELHHLYGSDQRVLEAWQLIDDCIGEVMEIADNVALVSDHGSGPIRHFTNVVPALKELGAFHSRGGVWQRTARVVKGAAPFMPSSLFDWTESFLPAKLVDAVLTRFGSMHDWMPGATEQYRARVDWSSQYLPLGGPLLCANPTQKRGDAVEADVMESISALPGVVKVWRKSEIYHGPYVESAPDLWIETESGVEAVARLDEEWEVRKPEKGRGWIWNHRANGIFGFYGDQLRPVELREASIYDMCPTILNFMGIPPPPGLDGRPLPIAKASSRDPHSLRGHQENGQ